MDINFGGIDISSSVGTYDKGAYLVRIKSIEDVQAKSGNDQIRIKAEFCTGQYVGKLVTEHITLVPACDWKVAKFIQACGIDLKTLGSMDTKSGKFRQLLNKLINKKTVWVLDVKDDRNTIVDYQPDPNPPAEEEVPEFLSESVSTADSQKATIDGKEVVWDD